MIDISGENVVLVGALLLFVAVMAGKVAYRFGAPALLLFLGVGMLFGLNFISFRSVEMTQFVGMIALCIILFTGGMDTSFQEIKPIIGPGVVLATVGVVMTAMVLAGFVWLVAPWLDLEISFALALLLAATMSSTDSASVFSILRSKKQGLKQHLRPLLELESSSVRQSALNLIRTARRYIEKLNMPSTLQAAGVNAAEFEEAVHDMAEAALADRCTATNPRSCTAEEIEQIFRKAYSGKLP